MSTCATRRRASPSLPAVGQSRLARRDRGSTLSVPFRGQPLRRVPVDRAGQPGRHRWAYGRVCRDLQTDTTSLASRETGPTGAKGSIDSYNPSISYDGRYVAFHSNARLSPSDLDQNGDIYVRDLQTDTTILASRATSVNGVKGNFTSVNPSISGDGTRVSFGSFATNLGSDTDLTVDTFVRDLVANTTTLVSRATGATGVKGNGSSDSSALSQDGRYVAFQSVASNLSPDDTDTLTDVSCGTPTRIPQPSCPARPALPAPRAPNTPAAWSTARSRRMGAVCPSIPVRLWPPTISTAMRTSTCATWQATRQLLRAARPAQAAQAQRRGSPLDFPGRPVRRLRGQQPRSGRHRVRDRRLHPRPPGRGHVPREPRRSDLRAAEGRVAAARAARASLRGVHRPEPGAWAAARPSVLQPARARRPTTSRSALPTANGRIRQRAPARCGSWRSPTATRPPRTRPDMKRAGQRHRHTPCGSGWTPTTPATSTRGCALRLTDRSNGAVGRGDAAPRRTDRLSHPRAMRGDDRHYRSEAPAPSTTIAECASRRGRCKGLRRAIWAAGQVRVYDGGADGDRVHGRRQHAVR